jgi:hypothetical protein
MNELHFVVKKNRANTVGVVDLLAKTEVVVLERKKETTCNRSPKKIRGCLHAKRSYTVCHFVSHENVTVTFEQTTRNSGLTTTTTRQWMEEAGKGKGKGKGSRCVCISSPRYVLFIHILLDILIFFFLQLVYLLRRCRGSG